VLFRSKPAKRLNIGDVLDFSAGDTKLEAEIIGKGEDGVIYAKFAYDGVFLERLDEIGNMPLPPYIQRESNEDDKNRYQTVYSSKEGSVAAPTAGLHFTEELLEKVKNKGVKIAFVTLHVGIGTFRPVKCDNALDHTMHFEEYVIPKESAEIINQTKASGGKVVAVGTTSVRTIESAVETGTNGEYLVKAEDGSTGIYIYPGFEFKIVDSLITNFHLPKSTLMLLISAFYNREDVLKAYEIAVAEKYRFFSYGDAMILK
jgi:S-adenosylmethionine:tRNA ribosyltransferase-isomerase